MRALSAGELLTVWEQGVNQRPSQRALALLAVACADDVPFCRNRRCDCKIMRAKEKNLQPHDRRAPVKIRTSNLLIRSQMLYPVELRVLRERLICGGRPGRQPQRNAFQELA